MYIFLLIINVLIYLISVICKKYHSKYPDTTVGYRTNFAIKNKDTWKEANISVEKYSKIGFILMLIVDCILWILNITPTLIIASLNFIIPFGFLFYTDIHLRNIFNKDGNLK